MKMIIFLVFFYLAAFICGNSFGFFLTLNEYYFFIIVHYSNIKASHDQESRDLKLNTSVQTLLETIRLADQNATENSNFIWDLLDPIIRFLLLNQTQVNFIFFVFY